MNWLAAAVLFDPWSQPVFGQWQQEERPAEARLLDGCLRAQQDALAAIRQGDVLIRHVYSLDTVRDQGETNDTPDGVLLLSRRLQRVRFDLDRRRFSMIRKEEHVALDLELPEDDPHGKTEHQVLGGFVFDGESITIRNFPGRTGTLPGSDLPQVLSSFEFPDFHKFGSRGDWTAGSRGDAIHHLLMSLGTVRKDRTEGDVVWYVRTVRPAHDPEIIAEFETGFDRARMVTVGFRDWEQDAVSRQRTSQGSTELEWHESGGLQLPSRSCRRGPTRLWLHDRWVSGEKVDLWEIFWFSVNQPMPAEMFQPDLLQQFDVVNRLVDERQLPEAINGPKPATGVPGSSGPGGSPGEGSGGSPPAGR